MKKVWNTPELETLKVNATAYNPAGGTVADGVYNSYDGKYTEFTYGTSAGNTGTPGAIVRP